jgi:purine-nucleoside/S-methyl-5'-thioadenosine phosphorylase / adenosine deaminase
VNRLIVPDIFKDHVTAFFTGKNPGADIDVISRMLGIKKECIFMPIQKHTGKVMVVESLFEPVMADAVVTKEKGLLIGVQVADCVPILIYGRRKGIVGAIHAGWRGAAEGILKKTIKLLVDRFYIEGYDITIAIGPSIGSCCYEVGGDVIDSVRKATGEGIYYRSKGDKYLLDLQSANKLQALSMGVPESNIWVSNDCTSCHPERFYSYRYARGSTGRQAGFIGII